MVLGLWLVGPNLLSAQEWACSQHDAQRTGRTDRVVFRLPPMAAWDVPTSGSVFGSPVIRDDGVILVSTGTGRRLQAFGPDGVLDWDFPTTGSLFAAPALGADGEAYVVDSEGYAYCVDAQGGVSWSYHNSTAEHEEHRYLTDPAPLPGGGIVAADWLLQNNLSVIQNGSTSARYTLAAYPAAPVTLNTAGTRVYFPMRQGKTKFRVDCVRTSNGTRAWLFQNNPLAVSNSTMQVSGICFDEANGRLFVSADYNTTAGSFLYSINAANGAMNGAGALDLGVGSYATPALSHDASTIYITLLNGVLRAIDTTTGATEWEYDSGALMIRGSAVVDGEGKILFGDMNGAVHCVGPDGQRVWKYKGDGSVIASALAIAANGEVVYGTANGRLVRLTKLITAPPERHWGIYE